MSDQRYRTIVADPPWPGQWSVGDRKPGASSGVTDLERVYKGKPLAYGLMQLDEICALPVDALAEPDAHLYLWIPDSLLIAGVAERVVRAWGFKPGRVIVWWAKRSLGLGRFPRPAHEAIVLGSRGDLSYNEALTTVGSVQEWKQPYANGAKLHSAKPDGAYDLIERASPGPYAELFARRARFGWDYPIGDQALGGSPVPVAGSER